MRSAPWSACSETKRSSAHIQRFRSNEKKKKRESNLFLSWMMTQIIDQVFHPSISFFSIPFTIVHKIKIDCHVEWSILHHGACGRTRIRRENNRIKNTIPKVCTSLAQWKIDKWSCTQIQEQSTTTTKGSSFSICRPPKWDFKTKAFRRAHAVIRSASS